LTSKCGVERSEYFLLDRFLEVLLLLDLRLQALQNFLPLSWWQPIIFVPGYGLARLVQPSATERGQFLTGLASLAFLDTKINKVVARVPLGPSGAQGPATQGVAVTPDGTHVFADILLTSDVFVVDTSSEKVIKTIPVGSAPGNIAITPDGAYAYVADYSSNSITVIDVNSLSVVNTFPLGNFSYGVAFGPQ
jgi:YVTN family beta-propeller protein